MRGMRRERGGKRRKIEKALGKRIILQKKKFTLIQNNIIQNGILAIWG